MPYIKQKEFERLKKDQAQLDKIVSILVQSLDNPPADGIAKAEDIAEDLVTRSNLLFKVNAENARLAEALDQARQETKRVRGFYSDTEEKLKKAICREALEIEANEDLKCQLQLAQSKISELQSLKDEMYRLRHSYRILEDEKCEVDGNVRRLKAALQSVLGCIK